MVARMNYLGQDRSEMQFDVEKLGKEMSIPRQSSWTKLKRLLRYLKGAPEQYSITVIKSSLGR